MIPKFIRVTHVQIEKIRSGGKLQIISRVLQCGIR